MVDHVDTINSAVRNLSERIAGQMDARLIESVISLFNSGILVYYVRTPRTSFNPDNCKMSIDAANGVRFEGREKIIKLEEQNATLIDLLESALPHLRDEFDGYYGYYRQCKVEELNKEIKEYLKSIKGKL